jgi:hypothetical protein
VEDPLEGLKLHIGMLCVYVGTVSLGAIVAMCIS